MGKADVDEFQRSITIEEFNRWKLYYKHQPFGRESEMLARVCKTIVDTTPRIKDVKTVEAMDFIKLLGA